VATDEGIASALSVLENLTAEPSEPPAMVVMPPDSGAFILRNRSGFIRLAVAALKAAQGQQQISKDEPWISEGNPDAGAKGLKPDPNAHIYLPEIQAQTRLQRIRSSFLYSVLLLALFAIFVIGLVTMCQWLGRWFRH
jgi:hypothetical protein